MESAPRPGNSGISSVIAVALLLAMVVLCASIVSLLVLQSVQDAAPETLHAQFQASADTHRLYLTGGDVLPIADLTFYDADGNVISGSVTFPNGKTGTNGNSGVWTPGEYVTVTPDSDVIGSIVAKSVNGNSVLVYRASESLASLPIGDMVPDWWNDSEIPNLTTKPKPDPVLPDPPENLGSESNFINLIQTNSEKQGIRFNEVQLINMDDDTLITNITYPNSETLKISIDVKPNQKGRHEYTSIAVVVYRLSNKNQDNPVWIKEPSPEPKIDMDPGSSNVELSFDGPLFAGDICYVTIERKDSGDPYRQTIRVNIT